MFLPFYILSILSWSEVLAFSPQEFKQFYATSTESYERMGQRKPPFSRERIKYGYTAPTERSPNHVIPAPGRPNHVISAPGRPWHPPGGTPIFSNSQRYGSSRPNTRFGVGSSKRPRPQSSPYHQQGIEVGNTRLEHVQNLVHLRNLHSLMEATEAKRRIPYGVIRTGKDYWEEFQVENDNNGTKHSSWAAQAIISDNMGQESLVVERGVKYAGPNPLTREIEAVPKQRYETIEIETLPAQHGSFRGRRGFHWNSGASDATQNSITRKPSTTLLKPSKKHKKLVKDPKENSEIKNQLDSPETRGSLRRNPVTIRTKVTASLGVENGPNFQVLSLPNVDPFSPQSTPTQVFIPLDAPPSSDAWAENFLISTTAQNDNINGVLPTPQDILAQMILGSTQPTFGSSSYSTPPTSFSGVGINQGYGYPSAGYPSTPTSPPDTYGLPNDGSGSATPGSSTNTDTGGTGSSYDTVPNGGFVPSTGPGTLVPPSKGYHYTPGPDVGNQGPSGPSPSTVRPTTGTSPGPNIPGPNYGVPTTGPGYSTGTTPYNSDRIAMKSEYYH